MLSSYLLAVALPFAAAAPASRWGGSWGGHWGRGSCQEPAVRKEWRTLSQPEQQNYLDAVSCMYSKPGPPGSDVFGAIQTHYDAFIANHINASLDLLTGTGGIHQTGVFLPWHRAFVWIWEQTLQRECGLQGSLPYWDWTRDFADLTASPLLQPDAFGGNGVFIKNQTGGPSNLGSPTSPILANGTGGGCITSGPFVNVTLNVGTGTNLDKPNPRCLSRNFNPTMASQRFSPSDVASVMNHSTFFDFRAALDPINKFDQTPPTVLGVHGGGHESVGAEMFDILSSPSEPLFYMHHSWLDSLWTNWQEQDPATRLSDISGPTIPNTVDNGTTTLDTMIWNSAFIGPSMAIRQTMDTQNRNGNQTLPFCYKYDNTP